MMRNFMFLIAMSLGIAGLFGGDTNGARLFMSGAVVAVTTMFLRFKDNGPTPVALPRTPTDPIDVLDNELNRLDSQMDSFSIDDDSDPESGNVVSFLKLVESRDKINTALIELAKGKK